jgi:nitrogen fixation protein NifU and related proteins
MKLESIYKDILVKHYREQRGSGHLEDYSHSSSRSNPTCGDQITVFARLSNGIIEGLSYQVIGCTMCQASASIMYDLCEKQSVEIFLTKKKNLNSMLVEKNISDLDELGDAAAFEGASNYPSRIRCINLSWDALHDAIVSKTESNF